MKPETIEALAIELTKAKIADKDRIAYDKTSAELWVKTYNESLDEINTELGKNRVHHKPSTAGQRDF
ncbi:hypothetical protein NI401_09640 [Acinetobacter indicus]|uniref:hypothetical protein n=1 Tax=Acinetobacter indicus TaxID=756892 RepID=UPI00209B04B1|nr:hypothetical protein [Acinetobacter indicus]MCO8103159.1 hypothetical protein [Acinetobacter indicus]